MSTFGLSFVGRFFFFQSVLYWRFHCSYVIVFPFYIPAPYTVYQFSVQAYTRVGPGDFSPPRTFSTSQDGKYCKFIHCFLKTSMHALHVQYSALHIGGGKGGQGAVAPPLFQVFILRPPPPHFHTKLMVWPPL